MLTWLNPPFKCWILAFLWLDLEFRAQIIFNADLLGLLSQFTQASANSKSNPIPYGLWIVNFCFFHMPSCIVTANPSTTSLNSLILIISLTWLDMWISGWHDSYPTISTKHAGEYLQLHTAVKCHADVAIGNFYTIYVCCLFLLQGRCYYADVL